MPDWMDDFLPKNTPKLQQKTSKNVTVRIMRLNVIAISIKVDKDHI